MAFEAFFLGAFIAHISTYIAFWVMWALDFFFFKECSFKDFFCVSLGCGTELLLGDLKNVGNSHGDWQTEHAFYARIINRNDRNYIMVSPLTSSLACQRCGEQCWLRRV